LSRLLAVLFFVWQRAEREEEEEEEERVKKKVIVNRLWRGTGRPITSARPLTLCWALLEPRLQEPECFDPFFGLRRPATALLAGQTVFFALTSHHVGCNPLRQLWKKGVPEQ
jgi:hypothetical protein